MGSAKHIPQRGRLIQNLTIKTMFREIKNESQKMSVVTVVEYFPKKQKFLVAWILVSD